MSDQEWIEKIGHLLIERGLTAQVMSRGGGDQLVCINIIHHTDKLLTVPAPLSWSNLHAVIDTVFTGYSPDINGAIESIKLWSDNGKISRE